MEVSLSRRTITGERAERTIRVCGPGAFVVLKALALKKRGENKDAYDLYYVVRNFGAGAADVGTRLAALMESESAQTALSHLKEDFATVEHIGPMRTATFISGGPDDVIQADAVAFVAELIRATERIMGIK